MAGAGREIPQSRPFAEATTTRLPGCIIRGSRSVVPGRGGRGGLTINCARADAAGVPQVTKYDGARRFPVTIVAGLQFEYFDASGHQIGIGRFATAHGSPCNGDRFGALPGDSPRTCLVRVRPARTFVDSVADLESVRRGAEEPELP